MQASIANAPRPRSPRKVATPCSPSSVAEVMTSHLLPIELLSFISFKLTTFESERPPKPELLELPLQLRATS